MRQTLKGSKIQFEYLHFEYKVTYMTIVSESAGQKFPASETKRQFQALTSLEVSNYEKYVAQGSVPNSPHYMDLQRIQEYLPTYYTLNREMFCSLENNKSKQNLFIRMRQMFNEGIYDASMIYYTGAANRQGNWVIQSQEFGEEEISFKDIHDIWAKRTSKQKHLLLILDSNSSGSWVRDHAKSPLAAEISVVAAAKENQKAFESEVGGYLTHNLLKYLNKKALENVVETPQTPQFGGNYLICKKFTNIFVNLNSWADLSSIQKLEYMVMDFDNGTYIGHVAGGQKHHWGVFLWKNGPFKDCKYLGEFSNGKLHGRGMLIYTHGRLYEGEFSQNTHHGMAVETYPNKDRYVGQFERGYKNGRGTYYYANGEIYEGDFKDNKPHGTGVLKIPNGNSYSGSFANGKCNGRGKFMYKNGDVYEGEWRESMKHGRGTYFYNDGSQYDGEFYNGVRHGFGKHVSATNEVYEGTWENDLKSGDGVFRANGQTFMGEYNNGKIKQTTKFFSKTGTQKLQF